MMLSVSSLRASLRAFKRAIIGPSALASGYWTTTTSWAPNSAEQCFKVPLEQSAAAGHLIVRAETGTPGSPISSIEVWYVDEISTTTGLDDNGRSHREIDRKSVVKGKSGSVRV